MWCYRECPECGLLELKKSCSLYAEDLFTSYAQFAEPPLDTESAYIKQVKI